MAEIIASAALTVIFEKLASTLSLKELARSQGIHSELKKWEASLSQIQAVLNDASRKEITEDSVRRWLNGLQHLAYDVDDMLDDLATLAIKRELVEESSGGAISNKVKKLIPTCCISFSLSTRMSDKLSNLTTKLQHLVDQKNTLGLIVKDDKSSKSTNKRVETSLVDLPSVVGRQGDIELLHNKVLGDEPCNQNFSIVPIVGMGGLGKTTLAKILYNETRVKDHFELKAWVCVSEEFDVFTISQIIFQNIATENKEFKDLNMIQEALKQKLSNKRFLLVLDDVWTDNFMEWQNLVLPLLVVSPGSKIIVTTRKSTLLAQLGYDKPYNLSSLSYEDALPLFCQYALGVNNFDSHSVFRPYGEGIVKKCDGLPLALIALGSLLRTKEEEEWIKVLNSEIWELGKGDEIIIPALRLSYNDLRGCLKWLFAYCSLFPKDYLFDKEELILLWMAEGFLGKSTTSMSQEKLGHEYFDELLSRSFFQHAPNEESLFVMHDLMNDLAKSVAGEFFLRLDNETDKDVKKEALEKYRHMSFVRQEYGTYEKFKVFESAKCLRTFLSVSVKVKNIWDCFYLSNKILVDLLPKLTLLRALCLSDYVIREVPESIGKLKHLRLLNLSRTRITCLPENVCNLYNLQTLIVSGCRRLIKLPDNFLKLKHLRHFDIRNTPLLNKMFLENNELKNLQNLSKIIIGGGNGYAIVELKNLKNHHEKVIIKGLEKVQNVMHAREANLLQKRVSELEVEWTDVFDGSRKQMLEKEVLEGLKPHYEYLKTLKIMSYGGTKFANWIGDPLFLRLTSLSISDCKKCKSLPPLGQLPSLKFLSIQGMDDVKVVGLELFGGRIAFPSLLLLSFENMSEWGVWSTNTGVAGAVFPCLERLYIEQCPNLVKISLEALPSLRLLSISKCGHVVLKSVVHVASSITTLSIDSISGLTSELWRNVIEDLGEVEEVSIERCDEIRYLWESEEEASKVLVNLKKLNVEDCSNLVRLGEKEKDNCGSNLTSLRILEIRSCDRLESLSCPNNTERFFIGFCGAITSVSFPTGGKKLNSLDISYCDELLEKELGGRGEKSRALINSSMSMLESLSIIGWPHLTSIPELSYFIHLNSLKIEDCEGMESFPDHELPSLTSLTKMMIINCPSMNASFPRGLWPPKLSSLEIGQLRKPMSSWGSQNFPSSLVMLCLHGSIEEDVSSCSQLSFLPSSLTSLRIKHFGNLESLSTGLQHLTSLQHLSIDWCPKMKRLPEMLFHSLLSLKIYKCPRLNERSLRSGYYWPRISHIPRIRIDELDMRVASFL